MVKFRIGFTIPADTLFDLVARMLPIEGLSVEQVMDHPIHAAPDPALPKKQRKKRLSKGPLLTEGINAILLGELAKGPRKAAALQPLLQAGGFSPNSVGSRLQNLREHGLVKQMGNGEWKLVEHKASA